MATVYLPYIIFFQHLQTLFGACTDFFSVLEQKINITISAALFYVQRSR